MYTVGCVLLVI